MDNNWYAATNNTVEKAKNAMVFRTYARTCIYPHEQNQHLLQELVYKHFGDNVEIVTIDDHEYRLKIRSKVTDVLHYYRIINTILVEFFAVICIPVRSSVINSSYTRQQQSLILAILEDIISGHSEYIHMMYVLTLVSYTSTTKTISLIL